MVKTHMKRSSMPLVIMEIQVNSMVKHDYRVDSAGETKSRKSEII